MHDQRWIASNIAHHGTMCLLEQVLSWDAQHVVCRSVSHRSLDNPLRAYGRLGAACAIEYAAQAMAVHGALLQPQSSARAKFGLLTSAREVELLVARLDEVTQDLHVSAQRLHSDERSALYSFALHADDRLLAHGRASLLLEAP
jgi:predicted hotdog family 3-hydroxylacyl-ACP dehydratase